MTRLAAACAALLGILLLATAPQSSAAEPLKPVKVIIPRDSVFVLNFLGGKDAGIFKKHGINVDVDVRPFAGFLAGLPSHQCDSTTYAGIEAIEKMNQGVDWAIIGGGLTVVQEIFVRKDSPIKSAADLRGKKLGTWSTGAGAFKSMRVAVMDADHLDIAKDTQLVQLAPPALFKLLEQGQVDAMINISSFTIRAASQPDKFRSIFSPNEYWTKKTGYPVVWAAPLVAWTSWVKEDPARARAFQQATEESFRWLRDPQHFDAVVKAHGALAGVTNPAEIATYKTWLQAHKIFMTRWDQKAVDAQWQFLDAGHKFGMLDKVPSEKEHALLIEAADKSTGAKE